MNCNYYNYYYQQNISNNMGMNPMMMNQMNMNSMNMNSMNMNPMMMNQMNMNQMNMNKMNINQSGNSVNDGQNKIMENNNQKYLSLEFIKSNEKDKNKIIIKCLYSDKLKDIIEKYKNENKEHNKNLIFKYNGKKLFSDLTVAQSGITDNSQIIVEETIVEEIINNNINNNYDYYHYYIIILAIIISILINKFFY